MAAKKHGTDMKILAINKINENMDLMRVEMQNLKKKWTAEDIGNVGKAIYDAVPIKDKPDWAASILLFVSGDSICPDIQNLIDISIDDTRWFEAHDAFQKVRKLTLENAKKGKTESLQQLIYDIAETTAKVIYNASGDSAPFDYHAGWRIAPRVKRITDLVADNEFEKKCWQLLIREPAHNKTSQPTPKNGAAEL